MSSVCLEVLSPFQKEKLEYYFRFLDPDETGRLDKSSINRLMKRVVDFTGWEEDSPAVKDFRQVHESLIEILCETAQTEPESDGTVTLNSWLLMWSKILPGAVAIQNLPYWLRLLPKLLFRIVDKKRNGQLTTIDLEDFYREIVHLSPGQARDVAVNAYNQITDHGHYPLDLDSYEQLFANFLIGKTPSGPGRYIFGCFEHKIKAHAF